MFWNLGKCVASQLYRQTLPSGRPWHACLPALHASLPAHPARIPSPGPAACRRLPAQCQMQDSHSRVPAILSISVCLADEACNHQAEHACPPAFYASLTALLARTPSPKPAPCKSLQHIVTCNTTLMNALRHWNSWLMTHAITTLTTLALQDCTILCQHKHSGSHTCSMQTS